jgi:hypothetical protein
MKFMRNWVQNFEATDWVIFVGQILWPTFYIIAHVPFFLWVMTACVYICYWCISVIGFHFINDYYPWERKRNGI